MFQDQLVIVPFKLIGDILSPDYSEAKLLENAHSADFEEPGDQLRPKEISTLKNINSDFEYSWSIRGYTDYLVPQQIRADRLATGDSFRKILFRSAKKQRVS